MCIYVSAAVIRHKRLRESFIFNMNVFSLAHLHLCVSPAVIRHKWLAV
jgi:hypothetical protein